MAKTLREAALTTRAARHRLDQGVHWRGIDPEVHLGYRKGKRGGTWLVRWRNGPGYRQDKLGTADDQLCEGTLSYSDAVNEARARVIAARQRARAEELGPDLTVRSVVSQYARHQDARESERAGRSVRSSASYRLGLHLLGRAGTRSRMEIAEHPLAAVRLHDLQEGKLIAWRAGLPESIKSTTRKRLISDLKAALNAAYVEHRHKLPADLPTTIKHGLALPTAENGADEMDRENQILADESVARIIAAAKEIDSAKAADGDLYRMIIVMAATGARFSQAARLRISDVQLDRQRILVPTSHKGRGRKNRSTPVPVGADVIDALLPIVQGRDSGETLLLRWHYKREQGSIRWIKMRRAPWVASYDLLPQWALIREAAKLPSSIVPYALRHSSIVRGIRAGLPIRLVAALHDTSVEMIERHYGRWIADGLEDLAAKAVVPVMPPKAKPHAQTPENFLRYAGLSQFAGQSNISLLSPSTPLPDPCQLLITSGPDPLALRAVSSPAGLPLAWASRPSERKAPLELGNSIERRT